MVAVMPPRAHRKPPRAYDAHWDPKRHPVKGFLGKMKPAGGYAHGATNWTGDTSDACHSQPFSYGCGKISTLA